MKRILIVEDDPYISDLIKINLEYSGFTVDRSVSGKEFEEYISKTSYSLVLLDLMLPDCDGFSLLPKLRKQNIPVIIISAKDRISDKINGLELGADDYITKPFDNIELIARIKALLRRSHSVDTEIKINELLINTDRENVYISGKKINLTVKEYELLVCLAENRGIIFSRDRLLERIWGYDDSCDTRTIDMHITRLRAKLNFDVIKTVYKRGYKIEI